MILFQYILLLWCIWSQSIIDVVGVKRDNDPIQSYSSKWQDLLTAHIHVDIDDTSNILVKYIDKSTHNSIISSSTFISYPIVSDRIINVDGIPMLSVGLSELLHHHDHETYAVPIIDDTATIDDGYRLLGFASIKILSPHDITFHRNIAISEPISSFSSSSSSHSHDNMKSNHHDAKSDRPPPQISSHSKGTITSDKTKVDDKMIDMNRAHEQVSAKKIEPSIESKAKHDAMMSSPTASKQSIDVDTKMSTSNPSSSSSSSTPSSSSSSSSSPRNSMPTSDRLDELKRKTDKLRSTSSTTKPSPSVTPATTVTASVDHQNHPSVMDDAVKKSSSNVDIKPVPDPIIINSINVMVDNKINSNTKHDAGGSVGRDDSRDMNLANERPRAKVKIPAKYKPKPAPSSTIDQRSSSSSSIPPVINLDDFYGIGKVYPQPYLAEKMSKDILADKQKKRYHPQPFLYSVRFRNPPLGLIFDNKLPDATRIEKVTSKSQAEIADIRIGDYLVAINTVNITLAPAKISLRLIQEAGYPIVLVFEAQRHVKNPIMIAEQERKQMHNISILYPPSLVHEFQVKQAIWTEKKDPSVGCSLYLIKAAKDLFGCEAQESEYDIPSIIMDAYHQLHHHHNLTYDQLSSIINDIEDAGYPMLAMLLSSLYKQHLSYHLESMIIMKRGSCTFVDKARYVSQYGGSYGLLVNNDDNLMDMPAGKENTTLCKHPFSITRDIDGNLIHTVASHQNEIIAIIQQSSSSPSSSSGVDDICSSIQTIIYDILDHWPNSIPHIPSSTILHHNQHMILPSIPRTTSEEGGRIAVSGSNGWAYFDYYQAMFGPVSVPLGPYRLQMAFPPHGCDVSQYSVRIKDSVVAILRGGGCSFGIKVINAQKLGAKAVLIVNTDDMKLMRLMALPDEVPLIKIPCIMVTRRIQYYLDEMLYRYHNIDQHIVSIQPMMYISDYEKKNTLQLPQRITVSASSSSSSSKGGKG